MLTRRTLLSGLALAPLAACTATPTVTSGSAAPTAAAEAAPVVVFVPGAMAAVVKQLSTAFAAQGRGSVSFEVGHTPVQREQLAKGAGPDVWIAASAADMDAAARAGLVDKAGVRQLARTKLVVILAPGNPRGLKALAELAKPGVKLLAGAENIPIGMATAKTLDKLEGSVGAGYRAAVEANVVSRELGVAPIVSKVSMGEADAGIVFITDVTPDAVAKGVTTLAIADDDNTVVPLSIAPVAAGRNKSGGAAFIEFMTTGAGWDVLAKVGFLAPAS